MEFILFIILAVIIFGSKGSQSISMRISDMESEDRVQKMYDREKEWQNRVQDIELEDRIIKGLRNRDPELVKELEETIEKYPEASLGQSAGQLIVLDEYKYKGAERPEYNATRILMANRGKLTCNDSICGIKLSFIGTTDYEREQYSLRIRDLVVWIDSKLREHGICEPLYYDNSFYVWPWSEIFDRATHGTARWEPMLYPSDKIRTYNPNKHN